jgi:RHS repeat-associated protein
MTTPPDPPLTLSDSPRSQATFIGITQGDRQPEFDPTEGLAPPESPSINLPQGGGAIRGIGEKFKANTVTGTASMAVPVPTSPGRSGFGPALTLTYDSGAGNSAFGLGWNISLPSIRRKTDKRLPSYQDDPDQDTFSLTGSDDLVPLRVLRDGVWQQLGQRYTVAGREFVVQRYRPRIEGQFSRIERWRDLDGDHTHWRTISASNVTTLYGITPDSRITDPDDSTRVFSWLISESHDDTGNVIIYDYAAEDGTGVDTTLASEAHRGEQSRSAGRYPKRIRYGNRVPGSQRDDDGDAHPWMFEVVFDYGDHNWNNPLPEPNQPWPCRPDPFSTHRPGFEIRTYRRCHRILMFHHFPNQPDVGADCVVCSTELGYKDTGGSGMTTVAAVVHTGYHRQGTGYHTESLPPLEFDYTKPVIDDTSRDLSADALANLPVGIDDTAYRFVDLDGEGLSGVLATPRRGGWRYKSNLGNGRFAPARLLATQPSLAGLTGRQQLFDLDGSGHLDLVTLGGAAAGYYERSDEPGWWGFRSFTAWPNIGWDDPDLRMVDLNGDGLADILIARDEAYIWYPSLGRDGFGQARRTYQTQDDDNRPTLIFADPQQTIYLADMSGDGLSDLVRVCNGDICYWPNLGYGRFGRKTTMDNSPWMDNQDRFDQRRVRLADVDGTGAADLIYLHPDGAHLYLNRSGNGYTQPRTISHGFPNVNQMSDVRVVDLLGTGTACLVWSSALPNDAGQQLRYIDLMADGKPYLLSGTANNLGAETKISYAPSTTFYLDDQKAGQPWITRLPFPVHVVERVEVIDRINHNKFTTRYAYHHGYYDGVEREFRGFGMVEQWDTERLAVLEPDDPGSEFENLSAATDLPPVLTRTWFHTGVFPDQTRITRLFADQYYHQPGGGDPALPDTTLPTTLRPAGGGRRPWNLSATDAREACRALKGMPLRREVYALDNTEAQPRPYIVTEHNYTIELLQPATEPTPDGPQNYHAVLLTHSRESLVANYERALYPVGDHMRADPRVTHQLVLAADDYGNPLRTASVAYGRRHLDDTGAGHDQASARLLLTYNHNEYTNAVDLKDAHRTPMPCRSRTHEITGLQPGSAHEVPPGAATLFGFTELRDALEAGLTDLAFQDWQPGAGAGDLPAQRLISDAKIHYRRDDLTGPLPLGVIEPRAIPDRTYRQVFTDSLVHNLYGQHINADSFSTAGYIHDGHTWWSPSGQAFYSPRDDDDAATELAYARRHFFLPNRFRDPFGTPSSVTYDDDDLLVVQTRDALGNLVTTGERDITDRRISDGNDYRVLAPRLISDPNRNRSAVAFDTLGRVSGTAIMGKPEEKLGDSLEGFDPDPRPADIEALLTDPLTHAHRLLGNATTRVLYDSSSYSRTQRCRQPTPAWAALLARETHVSDLAAGQRTTLQCVFTHSDGFGNPVQNKALDSPGPLVEGGPAQPHRWIVSGWTVLNNKGKPVRSYEPFFSANPRFEFARAVGVSAVLFYDPLGRTVATLHPNDTYEKTVFDPWRQDTWDANDTVLSDPRLDPDVCGYMARYLDALAAQPGGWSTWYAQRINGGLGDAQRRVAEQTAVHADSPTQLWCDPLGQVCRTVTHNRFLASGELTDQTIESRTVRDIQGNIREVRDGLDRAVAQHRYTMLSTAASATGMDDGSSWVLTDVLGAEVISHSPRGFTTRYQFDPLRRPIATWTSGPEINGEALDTTTEYGDTQPHAESRNLRTHVVAQRDQAGITRNTEYDFKGNLLHVTRQLSANYRNLIDWQADVTLEDHHYHARTSFDALNRPTTTTTPDDSTLHATYDPANRLARLTGQLRAATQSTEFIEHVAYNARGQQTLIKYGNGATTRYTYDPLTFRIERQHSTRGQAHLQDLEYIYDPVGNPTTVTDHAQQTIFFRNRVVDPTAHYTYDALYRLIEATGREHLGQGESVAAQLVPTSASDSPRIGLPQPGDGWAMARYIEQYRYDEAGNIQRVAHRSADRVYAGWTREYHYQEKSLLEPDRFSNRLTAAGSPTDQTHPRFRYDEAGNTTSMPPIPVLGWDYLDRLRATTRQSVNGDRLPETTYYVYDAIGERARKVTDRSAQHGQPSPKCERIYLGAYEIYREFQSDGTVALQRETLQVFGQAGRLALIETRTEGIDEGPVELIRYQLTDRLNSSVLELDQQAQIITYEEYFPYGSTSYQAVRAATETPKRYRYTGKERDTETGLYYYGARYYAPWLARWASADPAGLVDGLNLYCYVGDNPIALIDATGTQSGEPEISPGLDVTYHMQGYDVTYYASEGYEVPHYIFEPLDPSAPAESEEPPQPQEAQPPPATPPKPASQKPADDHTTEQQPPAATFREGAAAFFKGAAEGLALGIGIDAGIGFAAGLTGVAAGTLGLGVLVVGGALLAYQLYSHWDEVTAGVQRLARWEGTAGDWETVGQIAGGLLSSGASKPATNFGQALGTATRSAARDAFESAAAAFGPKFALPGGGEFPGGGTRLESRGLGDPGGGPARGGSTAPVNRPSLRRLTWDWKHILSRHEWGASLSNVGKEPRTQFPSLMNRKGIESAIREAYQNSVLVARQGNQILLRGQGHGMIIDIWVDVVAKELKTAYPVQATGLKRW